MYRKRSNNQQVFIDKIKQYVFVVGSCTIYNQSTSYIWLPLTPQKTTQTCEQNTESGKHSSDSD